MANPSSWFLYLRVKGEAERDLFTKHIPSIAIHKPGALLNRRNAPFGEKVGAWIPFSQKSKPQNAQESCVWQLNSNFRASKKKITQDLCSKTTIC